MSIQIKKNDNWVTVAGGTRMWVGTKAALQAALDASALRIIKFRKEKMNYEFKY